MRVAIEDLGLKRHPSNPPFGIVTISVGAAEITSLDGRHADAQWFDRVDRALYRAKAGGRNRIAMALPTSEPLGRPELVLEIALRLTSAVWSHAPDWIAERTRMSTR